MLARVRRAARLAAIGFALSQPHQHHACQHQTGRGDAHRQHRLAQQRHAEQRRKQHARLAQGGDEGDGATVMAQMAIA